MRERRGALPSMLLSCRSYSAPNKLFLQQVAIDTPEDETSFDGFHIIGFLVPSEPYEQINLMES